MQCVGYRGHKIVEMTHYCEHTRPTAPCLRVVCLFRKPVLAYTCRPTSPPCSRPVFASLILRNQAYLSLTHSHIGTRLFLPHRPPQIWLVSNSVINSVFSVSLNHPPHPYPCLIPISSKSGQTNLPQHSEWSLTPQLSLLTFFSTSSSFHHGSHTISIWPIYGGLYVSVLIHALSCTELYHLTHSRHKFSPSHYTGAGDTCPRPWCARTLWPSVSNSRT